MERLPLGKKLYKYLGFGGALKTLSNQTIKFSRPTEFNDPFDMRLDAAIGQDLEAFLSDQRTAFLEIVDGNFDHSRLRDSKMGRSIGFLNHVLTGLTEDQRRYVRSEMAKIDVIDMFNIERVEANLNELKGSISKDFSQFGVFCSTDRSDSLLMWAHYAEQHRGVVFEFTPDHDIDSILIASQPVRYSTTRPLMFSDAKEFVESALFKSNIAAVTDIVDRLIFSKSQEWSYENEFRLAIPDLIQGKDDFAFLPYRYSELSAVYLGYRMPEQQRCELVSRAKARNRSVKIFESAISHTNYQVDFLELDW